MAIISGILRSTAGAAMLGMAVWVSLHNRAAFDQLDGSVTVDLFGTELAITAGNLLIAIGACAALGLLLIVLGVFTCARRRAPAPVAVPPTP